MIMIRHITLWCVRYNTRIFAWHVGTNDNTAAYLLSRGSVTEKKTLCGIRDDESRVPIEIDSQFWPFPTGWLL